MLKPQMIEAINKQINHEWYSAYLYLAMSAKGAQLGMPGVATWFRYQAQEESFHAMKFYDYLVSQGAAVDLQALAKPEVASDKAQGLFEAALEHERFITGCINELMALSYEVKDFASQILLQWFVSEQVEEEANALEILDRFKLLGGDGRGLMMLDMQLAQRAAPTAPASAAD